MAPPPTLEHLDAQIAAATTGLQPKPLESYLGKDGEEKAATLRTLAGPEAADAARDKFNAQTCKIYSGHDFSTSWKESESTSQVAFQQKTFEYLESVTSKDKRQAMLEKAETVSGPSGVPASKPLKDFFDAQDTLTRFGTDPANEGTRKIETQVRNQAAAEYSATLMDVTGQAHQKAFLMGPAISQDEKDACKQAAPKSSFAR